MLMATNTLLEIGLWPQTREEMKKLASFKPLAGAYSKAQEDLKSSEGTREQIMGSLKACDEKLSGIKACNHSSAHASVNPLYILGVLVGDITDIAFSKCFWWE